MRGGLGLIDPKIIAAGSPHQSVIWLRMATAGTGHMPAVGSRGIDSDGIALIADWISSLPRNDELRQNLDALTASSDTSYSNDQRLHAASELLKSQEGVMLLAQAYATNAIVPWMRQEIIAMAMSTSGPMRDLLEAYAGEDQRPKRLGPNFPPAKVLDLSGNADHGRELFRSGVGQCNGCHQLEANGRVYGPDLSRLSNPNWKKADLLRQIFVPSELIDPKFVSTVVLTEDDQVLTGLVSEDNTSSLVLKDANNVTHTLNKDEVQEVRRSEKSLMPDGLFDALTAQQAADLLEYIWSISH
jgi:putative heme-binding domain-containing protein